MKEYFKSIKPKEKARYEQEYWGTVTDLEGNVRNRFEEKERYLEDISEEIRFINNLNPGKILDVGCGLGFLLSGINNGWEKYGVEISKIAAKHATKFGNIFCGELKEANYKANYFDVVVLYHVIEHIENPIDLLLEIRRILKPGGHLILGTPDFDSACARRFGKNYRLLDDKSHISLFTTESMYCFLSDYGFEIEHVSYPFFETRYFTKENLLRLFDTSKISPPFYGNIMTFYCKKNKF